MTPPFSAFGEAEHRERLARARRSLAGAGFDGCISVAPRAPLLPGGLRRLGQREQPPGAGVPDRRRRADPRPPQRGPAPRDGDVVGARPPDLPPPGRGSGGPDRRGGRRARPGHGAPGRGVRVLCAAARAGPPADPFARAGSRGGRHRAAGGPAPGEVRRRNGLSARGGPLRHDRARSRPDGAPAGHHRDRARGTARSRHASGRRRLRGHPHRAGQRPPDSGRTRDAARPGDRARRSRPRGVRRRGPPVSRGRHPDHGRRRAGSPRPGDLPAHPRVPARGHAGGAARGAGARGGGGVPRAAPEGGARGRRDDALRIRGGHRLSPDLAGDAADQPWRRSTARAGHGLRPARVRRAGGRGPRGHPGRDLCAHRGGLEMLAGAGDVELHVA